MVITEDSYIILFMSDPPEDTSWAGDGKVLQTNAQDVAATSSSAEPLQLPLQRVVSLQGRIRGSSGLSRRPSEDVDSLVYSNVSSATLLRTDGNSSRCDYSRTSGESLVVGRPPPTSSPCTSPTHPVTTPTGRGEDDSTTKYRSSISSGSPHQQATKCHCIIM